MYRTVVLACVSGWAVSLAQAADVSWASPVDGVWNTPANWSPAMVPTAADRAILGLAGPYTVNLNVNPGVSGLVINNPDAAFEIPGGRNFTIGADGIFNDGWIVVNPTNAGAVTSIFIDSHSGLDGNGMLTLSGFNTRARLISGTDALLTHEVNHTINGFGQITLRFDNQGWIVADAPSETLFVTGGPKTNSGVLSAIDNGVLDLSSTSIDQTGGGIIEANGGTVIITGSTITGGTLLNSGAPNSLMNIETNTLANVLISGDAQLVAGRTATIQGGSLTNNGLFTVNPDSVGATTTLSFAEPTIISGAGTIRLNGLSSRARMLGSGVSVENAASHSIRGFGQILVDLVNSGVVIADAPGELLEVNGGLKTNLSTMRAESGGTLQIASTTVDQSESAELLADGGVVQIGTSTVNNGRLVNSGSAGSDAVITSTTTLNDVTLEGQWTHSPGVTVTLRGVTDGSGTLLVNIGNVGATTTVNADEDVVLAGDGSIRLGGVASRARIISGAGVNITQGMDRSVIGFGQLLSGFVNNGLVRANVDGQSLLVSGQDKLNNAVFDAVDGGILEFQSTTFDQTGGGLIEADGGTASFSNTTMLGGTVRNTGAPGSEISIETNTFDSVVIDGDSTLVPGRTLTIGGTALTNDGLLSVNPTNVGAVTTLSAPGNTSIGGAGGILLGGTTLRARLLNATGELLTLGAGQTLSGIGRIDAETLIHGTIAPGLSVGTLTATRPVALGDGSTFACEFNDDGASDRFDSSSSVALDGTLELIFIDGYTAPSPEAFEIITTGANGRSGRFDQVIGDAPPAPLVTRVVYESDRVRVGFVCPADANLDGVTDLGDLNAVLANFGTNASLGDLNDDGAVDLADLNLVLANFGVDCQD